MITNDQQIYIYYIIRQMLKTLLSCMLMYMMLPEIQTSCRNCWTYDNCGSSCLQDYYGNRVSCSVSGNYYGGWNWGGNCWYGRYTHSHNWHNNHYDYRTVTYYRRCHPHCNTCNGGSQPDSNCQSCSSGYYLWWGDDRCREYCPSQATESAWNAIRGQYRSSSNQCQRCDSNCAWCESSASNCYTCIDGVFLVDDQAGCEARFRGTYATIQHSGACKTRQCWGTSCPSPYYFPVQEGSANGYTWTSNLKSVQKSGASDIHYRKNTDICIFCNAHCDTCSTTDGQDNCNFCSRDNYMRRQNDKYCQSYCLHGLFGASSRLGQFIQASTSMNASHADYRYCQLCHSDCVFCKETNVKCYYCKDSAVLMDLYSQCVSRYTSDTTCTRCQQTGINMCAAYSTDKYCKPGACPTYFYFKLYRVQAAAPGGLTDLYVRDDRYNSTTLAQSIVDNYGATKKYRQQTNFCMLCDRRCIRCDGPSNVDCQQCRNFYYKWVGSDICEEYCPPGQYIALDETAPTSQTQCKVCDNRCEICEYTHLNCTECGGLGTYIDDYNAGTTTYVGFLYVHNSSYSTCQQFCPASTSPLTSIGFYGSTQTMICHPCPDPCSNCNIQLVLDQQVPSCVDNLCSNGLICTDCLSGFALVAGQCIQQDNCRQYAYYNESATSTGWSADNCACLQGYSSTQYAKCNVRCYVKCKTCAGTGQSQCQQCEDGYTISGTSCETNNNLGSNRWRLAVTSQGNNYSPVGTASCGSYTYYRIQNQYFRHIITTTSSSTAYYAISVKMGLIFVEGVNPAGSIYITRSSSNLVWSWNFDTKGAYGQQICQTNQMQYILYVTAQLPTQNRSTQTIYIRSNQADLEGVTGTDQRFGIFQLLVTVLKCHSDCSRCTGPTQNDCISCATTGEIAVDGVCVCNVASGYYQWMDGICRLGCNANQGEFTDDISRKCVKPPTVSNCTAPSRFGYLPSGSQYGYCVESCPHTSYFATLTLMQCVTDCSAHSQYKYSAGGSRTCETTCPNGYIADPSTDSCVQKCPSTWFYQLENRDTNPMCVQVCPTGYAYVPLQQCVASCPSGYFKQNISSTPKCQATCQASAAGQQFGNPDTNQCVLNCPFPKYEDSYLSSFLCVDTCSNPAHFMQVKVADGERTCVGTCQNGQYGNRITQKCSNYTTDCPDGFYADTHTNLCQANCTTAGQVAENTTKKCQTTCTTGYADWASRTCVSVCPTLSPTPMFGSSYDSANKSCVTNCNFAVTGLYGDAQANRTCVAACSATPVATFGENSTSLCVEKCSVTAEFGDPFHPLRHCVSVCTAGKFSYTVTKRCVSQCPDSYYSDSTTTPGVGKCLTSCTAPYFADPVGNQCRSYCRWGYYGLPSGIRPCVQQCPYDWFGINMTYTSRSCVQVCDTGYWGDLQTSMCYNVKTSCSNTTYADAQKKLCVIATNCTQGTFADPFTRGCETTCSNDYYADDNINTCVPMCSDDPDQYGQWGICRSACISNRYADWQLNRTCVRRCSYAPLALYGSPTFRCVEAHNCPDNYYGDNVTQKCLNPCSGTFPFGDPTTRQCVLDCPDGYYGDSDLDLCVTLCNFATGHYADNQTGNCQTLCTLGTFGVNASATDTIPHCEYQCPLSSFARDSDRICVSDCQTPLYGDPITRVCHTDPLDCSDGYYANSVSHLCVLPQDCQTVGTHYFAQQSTKTCVQKCASPNYGDNNLWKCIPVCNQTHFGQNTTRLCVSDCTSYGSFAESQKNLCVSRCSDEPIKHYAETDGHICVQAMDCSSKFAENSSQTCVPTCGTDEWADPTTKRCVATCPNAYYKDDSTGDNLCSTSCPDPADPTLFRYRDNSTGSCVNICPIANQTFGYKQGDKCVHTCPDGFFAQVDANRRCVTVCKDNTWGNKISRICITDPVTECPAGTWADDFTHLCTELCSASQSYYGNNITKKCSTTCPAPSFAYDGTRVCIDICPASLLDAGLFGDPGTTPRKCYATCQTASLYRDAQASRTCVTDCTYRTDYKTYKDPTTMSCEAVCSDYPLVLYRDDNLRSCQAACAGTLKKNDANRTCVSTCPGLYDPTTDKCVDTCPSHSSSGVLYANTATNICVVATSCPDNTYADSDNNICTGTCPPSTYIHGKLCVYICPHNYYKNSVSRTCVIALNCPTDKYADKQSRSCVSRCVGTFADTVTKQCVDRCSGSTYGDPFTRKCETSCSNGLHIVAANNSCQSSCEIGTYKNPANTSCSSICLTPYYADNNTRSCVEVCSANPITFSTVVSSVRLCVSACAASQFHDMVNRKCVTACPTGSYAYSVNMSCVASCPGPSYYQLGTACVTNCSTASKFSDDISRTCVSTCPTGSYKDFLTYKCVVECPTSPNQYYISENQGRCTLNCPEGTYANSQNMQCTTQCPISPRMFAEDVNNICVDTCPVATNSFADASTGKCRTTCAIGQYADSLDRTCKQNCSFLFADSATIPPACVAQCTGDKFADELTYKCVATCPDNYYAHTPTKKCVQFCPYGYFADSSTSTRKCVVKVLCPAATPYADNLTHKCTASCSNGQYGYLQTGQTSGGQCVFYCPPNYFSNPLTGKCHTSCPDGYFSETVNQTCAQTCPDDKFMDSENNHCTSLCPADDNLFADTYNHTCVTSCDPATFTYADSLTRVCEHVCTGNQYADQDTQTCVGQAQCSDTDKLTDPHYKKCVDVCYNGTFAYEGKCITQCPTASDDVYADLQNSKCVQATSCPDGKFGDPVLKQCVQFCPISSNTFANADTKKCVLTCTTPYFADNTTRTCVDVCPEVPVMFGDDETTRRCVHQCPSLTFADQTTNLCKDQCPDGYFADISTNACVVKCPEGKYGNTVINKCVDTCPSSPLNYYGVPQTRECLLECPDGLYADVDHNRECQPKCSGNASTYAENSTKKCVTNCLTGFRNQRTKQCIAVCTAGWYGYQRVCYQTCPSVSPTVFADDSVNLCVEDCPDGTFGDLSTRKCVQVCPVSEGTFGNSNNNMCVDQCLADQYADSSTRRCVETCPQIPALYGALPSRVCVLQCVDGFYADNQTRRCITGCPVGTFADQTTNRCESVCPLNPLRYGQDQDNKCVEQCSIDRNLYADNSTHTCVSRCSADDFTFADPTTRSCVDTCPENYFARNDTQTCETICPADTFADPILRICVQRCSIDPVYYGDRDTWKCVIECPSLSYGNPLNQQCQKDLHGRSTCPDNHYADTLTQLCLPVCSMQNDLYGDPITKYCQASCSSGYIADNSTMLCVDICPEYPNYFQNQLTHRCVFYCPDNTFADPISRKCVSECPENSFAQAQTQRCVTQCQDQPLGYADQTTWTCVAQCPQGYFADNSTLKCVEECPQSQNTYGEREDNVCVKVCPEGFFADETTRQCETGCTGDQYADDSSKKCVTVCPKYPAYFADPTTNTCVEQCPLNYYAYEEDRTCLQDCPGVPLYRQNSTRTCVSSCDFSELTFADNHTGYCVLRCTVNTYADPTTHTCVSECPDQPLMYAHDGTQSCVARCPGSTYGQNTTRSCVESCPPGSLSFPDNNLCVLYCPIGYFAFNDTAFCLDQCPLPYYGDPSTRSCVSECPISQLLYADNQTRQCVSRCSAGTYADKQSVSCVSTCPDAPANTQQTYAADYNNVCVQQCTLPYFGYPLQKKCVNNCPDPYYNDVRDHMCYLCPDVCRSCSAYHYCTLCISAYYLQNGQCVTSCQQGYYANDALMKCVSSTSCRPNYGLNSTRQCSTTCPSGSYKNSIAYRCDACQPTCLTCLSWSVCSTCIAQSMFGNNYCYPFCNSTHSYYSRDNQTCLTSCLAGTYLSLLYCKPCDSICVTCSITSNNCTQCSQGLYLQNQICVSQCSSTSRPNTNKQCVPCSSTCPTGLDFTTNITNINGENTVFVTFTDDVTFGDDLENIFGLQERVRRRLEVRLLANYRIEWVDSKTVKIVLLDEDAQNFQVKILKPEEITDSYGNIPIKTRDEVHVDLSDSYTQSVQTVSNRFSGYFQFLAIICIISFLFDLQFMKFMQLIFIHYFVAMILPPELSKSLSSLRYSTLSYLPHMYPIPEATLRNTVPGKIYDVAGDFSFLRNAGFALTPLAVLIFITIVLKLLSIPEINRFKKFRIWCKQQFDQKFKIAFFIEWVNIFFLNTVFFSFMQMRDYTNYDTFYLVSIIMGNVLLLFLLLITAYITYKVISFFLEHPKLSQNLKKATNIILNENQYDKLNSANIFLFEMKKLDLRNIFYPKINNDNIFPFRINYRFNFLSLMCLSVTYFRALIISIIIVFGHQSTLLQMGLCLPLNILSLLYFCRGRPYSFKFKKKRFRNYIAIFNEAALIVFELLMLSLAILDRDGVVALQKEQFSYAILYYLVIALTVNFIYFLFRVGVQIWRKIFLPFSMTELFRNNFPQAYQKLHGDGKKKLLKGVDPRAKQLLREMVKSYKKQKSGLRPNEDDKANPQLPIKHKITYFDRDSSSIGSRSSLTKNQRRKMLKELFDNQGDNSLMDEKDKQQFQQIRSNSDATETQYEEYEEQIEINARDLQKYVKNAEEIMKLNKNKYDDEEDM